MRAAKANREIRLKSYEAVIDGILPIQAYSQREAVEEARKFMRRVGIRPSDNHVQVFLSREPTTLKATSTDGDWDKEPL